MQYIALLSQVGILIDGCLLCLETINLRLFQTFWISRSIEVMFQLAKLQRKKQSIWLIRQSNHCPTLLHAKPQLSFHWLLMSHIIKQSESVPWPNHLPNIQLLKTGSHCEDAWIGYLQLFRIVLHNWIQHQTCHQVPRVPLKFGVRIRKRCSGISDEPTSI